ncbi:MAG: metallophosphoesterase [Alphaproteobacteria bacterium]|nr:metallophosphoesterase [Alphaproteobacteria bacterium]
MRGVISRRQLLTGAAALPLVFAASRAVTGTVPLAFLLIGDWGREGEDRQRDVAEQMGRIAAQRQCKFVVTLGDNFYERGVENTQDPHWQDSFEQIYTAESLQVPWYAILGNHDYYGNPDAQIEYSKLSSRWRMPARYYQQSMMSTDGATIDMFFLDTVEIEENYVIHHESDDDDENRRERAESHNAIEQLVWLEGKLAASRAAWKLVFGHHPIMSGGEHGPTEELVMAIKPLLERYRVAAYFNGHDHDLQHIVGNGIHYIGCGAGSQTRTVSTSEGARFFSDREGFAVCTIDARRMLIDFIDYKGERLYAASIDRA